MSLEVEGTVFWNVNIWGACLFIYRALAAERLIYPRMCLQTPPGSGGLCVSGRKDCIQEQRGALLGCWMFVFTGKGPGVYSQANAVVLKLTTSWVWSRAFRKDGTCYSEISPNRPVVGYRLRHTVLVSFYCWLVHVWTNSQLKWMHYPDLHCMVRHLIRMDMTVMCSITLQLAVISLFSEL